jgi:AbiV family abortive infection protein
LDERGRFGTAVGLAILAREELGKARILIQLSGEVEAGTGLSPRELSGALADHLEKQEHAQISVVLSAG